MKNLQMLRKPLSTLAVLGIWALTTLASLSVAAQPKTVAKQSDLAWQPERTWVFVVGVLEWQDSRTWPSFPKKNRRDRRLLHRLGELGVPARQAAFYKDEQATVSAVRSGFQQFLKGPKPGDTLLLYYAGHGYRDEKRDRFYMVPYDGYALPTLLSLDWFTQQIEAEFQGDRVILAADCCYSGAMREFAVNSHSRHPYAAFSSSDATSQSTGNWTFTDCLVEFFGGNPILDTNHDGQLSLKEGGDFVEKEMAFAEGQEGGLSTSPNFGAQQGWLKTSRPPNPGEGELVIVRWHGADYKGRVQERKGRQVLIHWLADPTDSPDEWVDASTVRSSP